MKMHEYYGVTEEEYHKSVLNEIILDLQFVL